MAQIGTEVTRCDLLTCSASQNSSLCSVVYFLVAEALLRCSYFTAPRAAPLDPSVPQSLTPPHFLQAMASRSRRAIWPKAGV